MKIAISVLLALSILLTAGCHATSAQHQAAANSDAPQVFIVHHNGNPEPVIAYAKTMRHTVQRQLKTMPILFVEVSGAVDPATIISQYSSLEGVNQVTENEVRTYITPNKSN